jgi:putative hydrolase of the HAD superfamily
VPLKAVAFDVDGTLYPNASMYLHSLGLALTNLRLIKTLEQVRGQLRDRPDASDDFHHVQARLMAARLSITPERAYALVEGRVYTRWYRIFRRLKPFPGLAGTLGDLKSAGLKLAVLSDFPIRNRLVDLGLAGPWDVAFSSEETGYLKPHAQPFRVLAERLDLPPEEILYVGNSYTYDVMGAFSAGMPCAHLTGKPRNGSQAVLSFSHYTQLRDFVFCCLADPGYNAFTGRVPY